MHTLLRDNELDDCANTLHHFLHPSVVNYCEKIGSAFFLHQPNWHDRTDYNYISTFVKILGEMHNVNRGNIDKVNLYLELLVYSPTWDRCILGARALNCNLRNCDWFSGQNFLYIAFWKNFKLVICKVEYKKRFLRTQKKLMTFKLIN
jgi:hypothetical protein